MVSGQFLRCSRIFPAQRVDSIRREVGWMILKSILILAKKKEILLH
jgi:hypothetical protein